MDRGEHAAARLPHLRAAVTESKIRQVDLRFGVASTIAVESARSRDGNETGGILLGEVHANGIAQVRVAGEAGPRATRRPTYFLRDLEHARHLADKAFIRDGSVWIGEWHTHLHVPAVPSAQDLHTYQQLLSDPDLDFDVVISIIVTGSGTWTAPAARAWACYPGSTVEVPLRVDADVPPRTASPSQELS